MTPRNVSDFELSWAERKVVAECGSGGDIVLGNEVPQSDSRRRRVRADLIRLLLLGDDPQYRLHERGVRLAGAWIPDLCRDLPDIALLFCRRGHRCFGRWS